MDDILNKKSMDKLISSLILRKTIDKTREKSVNEEVRNIIIKITLKELEDNKDNGNNSKETRNNSKEK